jgi:transposase
VRKIKRLTDEYCFPGFRVLSKLKGIFGDPRARLITLKRRRRKTICGTCGKTCRSFYDQEIRRVRDLNCGALRIYLELSLRRVNCPHCHGVRQERLDFLAKNHRYTRRFAFETGRRCARSAIKDIARELHLGWHAVKNLDKEYMAEQLRRAGNPAPKQIGIDEISQGKGQDYRITVSDLKRKRPIWFGGKDRTLASMDEFYTWLGPKRALGIELAVMDMWEPFRLSTEKNAPQAAILFDKFHVLNHLSEALDEVRRSEYQRLEAKGDRRFIKGQRYNLLSHWANLKYSGRQSLKLLFAANKRLNVAYFLKESFEQLWDYQRPGCALKFFLNWWDALRWQRLKSYEKFARMVWGHWRGIEAYCQPENKVSLGFVEGLNNKTRVIQRRAYGLHDEEYLRLKVLTMTLPLI